MQIQCISKLTHFWFFQYEQIPYQAVLVHLIIVHNHHTFISFCMIICHICTFQRFTSVALCVTLWKKGGNLYGISKMSSMQQ